jgi:hypothetical protein
VTVVEDRTAFVEQLGVVIPDRRAEKQRRRVAGAKVQALKVPAEIRLASDLLGDLERRGMDEAARDIAALRSRLRKLEKKAARKRERLRALENDVRERDARARHDVTFRLHSARHYVDLSRGQYERLSAAQRTSPMLVLKSRRLRWWWYRDRFWWADENAAPSQVATNVFESDLDSGLERHLFEEARDAKLRGGATVEDARLPDDVRRAVWQRDAGCCVDCGSAVDVRFDYDQNIAVLSSDDVCLLCRTCSILRLQPGSGAQGGLSWP